MIDRLPNSRNPTISVFEVRSIAIEEHLYTLSKLSINYLLRETQRFQCLRFARSVLRSIFISCWNDRSISFGRSWLIRWRSLRFAESIFGVMVLGSIAYGTLRDRFMPETNLRSLILALVQNLSDCG
jgi:hypothetical protein